MSENKERLKEIIQLADKLGWILPPNDTSYPLMQLSEVEKCMVALYDDAYLDRLRRWAEGLQSSTQTAKKEIEK